MARAPKRSKKAVAPKSPSLPLCCNPPRPDPQLHPAVTADHVRTEAILRTHSKWVNGTVLHYCFYTAGHFSVPKVQADAIRGAFAKWKAVGIGLEFHEVNRLGEAEIRIGYSLQDRRSGSAVGRGVLMMPFNVPTTVFGWDLTTKYGSGTALHELGHVLGMEHEHQNPFAGIKWHEAAVYKALSGPPNNWNPTMTFNNILRKLSPQQVQGSKWDPDSIMEYPFKPGLIAEPKQYEANGLSPPATLSAADKQWALKWYPTLRATPKTLQPFQPAVAELAAGQQIDYAIKPTASQKYTIEARGASDALLVLFEEINGVPRYLAGDDDNGQERSASISCKLFEGRSYIARLRLSHPGPSGKTSLMYS